MCQARGNLAGADAAYAADLLEIEPRELDAGVRLLATGDRDNLYPEVFLTDVSENRPRPAPISVRSWPSGVKRTSTTV